MKDNTKTIFQLGKKSVAKAFHSSQHAENVAHNLDKKCLFHAEFLTSLQKTKTMLGSLATDEFETLVEETRYSNPVSSLKSRKTEDKLMDIVTEFYRDACNGIAPTKTSIDTAQKLLNLRNQETLEEIET